MRARRIAVALLTLILSGCTEGPTSPSAPVAGTYIASAAGRGAAPSNAPMQLSTTEGGVTIDRLAEGSEVRLVLAADGSTSGRLFISDAEDGDGGSNQDFEANLIGSWSLDGGVITLHQTADTFLRDMPLSVQGDKLVGDATFGTVRIRLTLVRQ